MEITNRFKNALAAFKKIENKGPDPNAFLKYGSRKMPSTWSTPEISDEDFYTGYGFAVINKRANRSVVLGKKFLYTDAKEDIIKKANEDGTRVVHPYLSLIKDSTEFAERDFWYDISTYLDLEGIYYLMAVRAVTPTGKVGKIQKFVLLNPYKVRPVVNSKGELGGYIEQDGNKQREIPKEMMIVIRQLNPFDKSKSYSLADAARDAQFTLKQANNFSREAIDGNLNTPGIISSAIELPDDQFDNFVDRIKNHGRGEPLFGNGAGTVSWTDMQTDLEKAALDKVNNISRESLIAVAGTSKTGMGIEESGTGREVSRTQKDDFTENAIMPQIEKIIDSLNLDYRRYYADQYSKDKYSIVLDNPLETDRDAEKKDVEISDARFDLYQKLVSQGYPKEVAAKYAKGLLDITDLGEPTEEDTEDKKDDTPDETEDDPKQDINAETYKNKSYQVYEGYPVPILQYLGEHAEQFNPISEQSSFIYSTTEGFDRVTIHHLEEAEKSLIGVVNENTFVKLGEFHDNADRVAILAKLNKRYKNQPVAVKKKIDLNHTHEYDVAKIINARFDKQEQIESNTNDLLGSAQAAEDKLYRWYVDEINGGNLNPHPIVMDDFTNPLSLSFAVYFTVMFPIYASYRVQETAKGLGITDELPVIALTEEVKETINDFSRREAISHMNTMRADLENALAIIRARTSDPEQLKQQFGEAYTQIQARRSQLIASNAAKRIFNISQFEADLQFLTRADMVSQAYKVMFSLTGKPCPVCSAIIAQTNASPIPFTSAFVELGETVEGEGRSMRFDYESIIAGNVHPNCNCAYKLVIGDKII